MGKHVVLRLGRHALKEYWKHGDKRQASDFIEQRLQALTTPHPVQLASLPDLEAVHASKDCEVGLQICGCMDAWGTMLLPALQYRGKQGSERELEGDWSQTEDAQLHAQQWQSPCKHLRLRLQEVVECVQRCCTRACLEYRESLDLQLNSTCTASVR